MKNNITSFFLLLFVFGAYAQDNFKPEIAIGVNGGMTFSKIDFIPKISQKSLNGVNGGITFRYISEKHFGIVTELNFSQRGWKEVMTDSTLNYSHTLNYVEVPFMSHLYFGKNKLRFYINFGPKIGFLLGDKEIRNFDNNFNIEYSKPIENRFDYGICGGSGFELHTKIGNFAIEGRYSYGLSDIFKNGKKEPFNRSSNRVVSANIIYLINL